MSREERKMIGRMYPGDLLGEISVMTGETQAYTMKAGKAETVVAMISAPRVNR